MPTQHDLQEILDRFFRLLLDGAAIPKEYKKKKRQVFANINKNDIPRIIYSTGRGGFSTRVEVRGDVFHVSFKQDRLRVWINSNWNVDPPTLEGDVILDAAIRIIEEIRTRQFLIPEQIDWLLTADPARGCLAGTEAKWLLELHRDHDVIIPGNAPQIWTLSPFGWEVWHRLQRQTYQPVIAIPN